MATTYSVPRAPRASKSGIPIVADTHQLSQLARDLASAAPEAWAACRVGLRAAGNVVAVDARERASFSTRIPGSIKVRTLRGNVKLIAGGESAPNAAPIENKGKGFVRHPVFIPESQMGQYRVGHALAPSRADHPGWGPDYPFTSKNSRPAFLAPALDAHREEVLTLIEKSVTDAVHAAIEGR